MSDRKSGRRTATGQFGPGNPGKPKGARHKVTIAVEELLEGEGEAIGRVCIEKAKAGDPVALRLAMERISPVRRGRPVKFQLPAVSTANDVVAGISAVLHATAHGDLTPEEGAIIAGILETKRRGIETVEIERRLAELEAQMGGRR
jgi:uncharacterized protein DUF5681